MQITFPFLAVISAFFTTITTHPQATVNVKLNIKGVYSGTVRTDGRNVTTHSGGTHLCDGTNYGANPTPGGTPTTALADAADRVGFTFDGDWYQQYDDFFITEIGGIKCNWVFTINGHAIDVGGCQAELAKGDIVDWYCM